MPSGEYDRTVFINCPFDAEYAPIFEAIVFAIHGCSFTPKCARERLDSSQIRIAKITQMIGASRYSIHDLSRTELDATNALPRFNMPLELGIDLGCKAFSRKRSNKSLLIFDSESYRFQKYISDIGGQDVHHHANDPRTAVIRVRDWLRTEADEQNIAGGAAIYEQYLRYRGDLPKICTRLQLDIDRLTFADFSFTIALWLRQPSA